MASEIRGISASGRTLYAHVLNSSGQRWNGGSFETYAAGNYANYDIALTEQGSSGAYFATMPAAITEAGNYEYLVYRQIAGSPAEGDPVIGTGTINWNGTISASEVVAGSMSGSDFLTYCKHSFKRDDKDTELYEAITDAITELRRVFSFDESEVETTTTDTIGTLGEFKLDLETDLGRLIGDIMVVDGDNSQVVRKISKELYNEIYPNPSSATAPRGKPIHFAIFDGQIYLGYVPDSIAYTYRLDYSKGAETITSVTVSVPFTKKYREALRAGALAKVWGPLDKELAAEQQAYWDFFKNQIMMSEESLQKSTGFVEYSGL